MLESEQAVETDPCCSLSLTVAAACRGAGIAAQGGDARGGPVDLALLDLALYGKRRERRMQRQGAVAR